MVQKLEAQLTIVAHYGSKPTALISIISTLQDKLAEFLGSSFRAYDLEQVHGTIIGLEGLLTERGVLNRWFKENLDEERFMMPDKLLKFLRSEDIKDIELKIGGWHPHYEYGFKSRGQHPFLRSFSIRGEIAVAMGWPIKNGNYSDSLYQLRVDFEKVNVLHKRHKEGYKDNDFFFVLGRINKGRINPWALERTLIEMRYILAEIDERIKVGKDVISIVAYIDHQLPLATSKSFSLDDQVLTPKNINLIYQQSITWP